MTRGGSQLTPPFVVRENQVGPRFTSVCVVSNSIRSQTAYTRRESNVSAVMDSLSLTMVGSASAITAIGSLHVVPWSVERLTSTPLFGSAIKSIPNAIWCAVPLGENVTHGSEARSYLPPAPRLQCRK